MERNGEIIEEAATLLLFWESQRWGDRGLRIKAEQTANIIRALVMEIERAHRNADGNA